MDCSALKLEPDHDCVCHDAVLRAHASMIAAQRPAVCALQVAKIVYAHHHPEVSKTAAALTVERWVHHDRLH